MDPFPASTVVAVTCAGTMGTDIAQVATDATLSRIETVADPSALAGAGLMVAATS